MSDKAEKTRISVTLTKIYLDGLNHLVDVGLYLNRGEIILEALRSIMRRYDIEPFTIKSVEEPVESTE